jgi:hypothetical protein
MIRVLHVKEEDLLLGEALAQEHEVLVVGLGDRQPAAAVEEECGVVADPGTELEHRASRPP